MVSNEEAREKLEVLSVGAYEELDRSLDDNDEGMDRAVPQVIIIGDAHAQLGADSGKRSESVEMCAHSLSELAAQAVRLKRVSPSITKLVWLSSEHMGILAQLRKEAREELFLRNPQYHGKRLGREYAKAVATGRLALWE